MQESPASSRKVLIENSLEEMSCMMGSPHREPKPEPTGQDEDSVVFVVNREAH